MDRSNGYMVPMSSVSSPGYDKALKKARNDGYDKELKKSRNGYEPLDLDSSWRLYPICKLLAILTGAWVFSVLLFEFCFFLDDYFETDYSLEKNGDYGLRMITKEYGVEFYVKSSEVFEKKYPSETLARADIEKTIFVEYVHIVQKYCDYELQWSTRLPDYPTTYCNKLQSLKVPVWLGMMAWRWPYHNFTPLLEEP